MDGWMEKNMDDWMIAFGKDDSLREWDGNKTRRSEVEKMRSQEDQTLGDGMIRVNSLTGLDKRLIYSI